MHGKSMYGIAGWQHAQGMLCLCSLFQTACLRLQKQVSAYPNFVLAVPSYRNWMIWTRGG